MFFINFYLTRIRQIIISIRSFRCARINPSNKEVFWALVKLFSDRKASAHMTQKNTMILLTEKRSHTGSGKTFSDQKATVQRHQKTLFFAQIEWFYSALQKLIQNLMQT